MKKEQEIKKGEIVIYKAKEGSKLNVYLERETVWLSQKHMAELFDKDVRTINEHIKNIFKEGELKENSVIRNFRITAADGKTYKTNFYNLDVIISVGYRVKSLRGTQFRIWATKVLKQHLMKLIKSKKERLSELKAQSQLGELQKVILFLEENSKHKLLAGQGQEILNLLANYSKTLTLLEQYDNEKLKLIKNTKEKFVLEYSNAKQIIKEIKKELIAKKETSDLFGQDNGDKLKGIIGNIYQTFNKKALYSSLEEKAAHLLYFIIKDHPFVGGNKRIGSFLFVYFLDKNNYLYKDGYEKKINDNALTALALLIAIGDPKEKDTMIKIITNLLMK